MLARANIARLYDDGVSQAEIARRAGVSRQRINQIIDGFRRARWRSGESTPSGLFGVNKEIYGRLPKFKADRESARRTRDLARKTREVSRGLREIRQAYLEAHPRASPKAKLVYSSQADQDTSAPMVDRADSTEQSPPLRLVV
jgi:hypothetical protein